MKFSALTFFALPILAGTALAGSHQPAQVVELFTSQGCSSCPPANERVTKFANDDDILALSYSVTYWDYLGWKDTFGKPEFTKRQKIYAKAFDGSHVYTPQMVLNGAAHSSKFSKSDIHSYETQENQPSVTLWEDGKTLKATILSPESSAAYNAVIVEYVPGPQSIAVKGGENRGRVLTLTNVVTSVKAVGAWEVSLGSDLDTEHDVNPGKAYALLLHDPETLKISAAASYVP